MAPLCSAYLSMSEAASVASSNFAPYDQYEVSVPMEIAGDCLHMVSALPQLPAHSALRGSLGCGFAWPQGCTTLHAAVH